MAAELVFLTLPPSVVTCQVMLLQELICPVIYCFQHKSNFRHGTNCGIYFFSHPNLSENRSRQQLRWPGWTGRSSIYCLEHNPAQTQPWWKHGTCSGEAGRKAVRKMSWTFLTICYIYYMLSIIHSPSVNLNTFAFLSISSFCHTGFLDHLWTITTVPKLANTSVHRLLIPDLQIREWEKRPENSTKFIRKLASREEWGSAVQRGDCCSTRMQSKECSEEDKMGNKSHPLS